MPGSHLARLDLRVAIGRFHERIAWYRLAEGTRPSTTTWESGA